jgi:hypothetical protein
MSAAATAAGYLYASGRLRGRGGREEGAEPAEKKELQPKRREPRVAVYDPEVPARPAEVESRPERPKRVPKVEYRVRRWKPGSE